MFLSIRLSLSRFSFKHCLIAMARNSTARRNLQREIDQASKSNYNSKSKSQNEEISLINSIKDGEGDLAENEVLTQRSSMRELQ